MRVHRVCTAKRVWDELEISAHRIGPRIRTSGDSVWGRLTFSAKTVKSLSVFDDVRGGAFSTAGAMNFHEFAKPLRLCRKLKTAALVHKNCTGYCTNESRT